MEENPYQAPAVAEVAATVQSDAEAIRLEHIKHEASLKSLGSLMLLGGLLVVVFMVFPLFFVQGSPGGFGGSELIIMGIVGVLAVFQIVVGYSLGKLASWTRIPTIILCALALINIPIGTLIGGYGLYLILSAKGQTIFSPAYREIINSTPHVKYRTPVWMWIVLLLVIVLIVVGLLAPLFFA
ncbi:conserved hypothetical protein [Haloferula helveola]|uniref:Yip1 domain-containing protein n=1 Tax=Haloferula helveola TaxID=490095 RepID=A0ABN6HE12_9BACT|nr:conserved hypothetical protein [Haloferula helveola]